jgi:tRNA1Val (adenine37-N6)-methyltransferase
VSPLSLAAYAATRPSLFSHIICNPPFFRRSLTSPDTARATARHEGEGSLTFDDIIGFAGAHLVPGGTLSILLPPPEMQQFEQAAAASGLPVRARLVVQHRPGGRVTRCISEFGREAAEVRESSLTIQDANGQYSAGFRALLAGFYLAL